MIALKYHMASKKTQGQQNKEVMIKRPKFVSHTWQILTDHENYVQICPDKPSNGVLE